MFLYHSNSHETIVYFNTTLFARIRVGFVRRLFLLQKACLITLYALKEVIIQ